MNNLRRELSGFTTTLHRGKKFIFSEHLRDCDGSRFMFRGSGSFCDDGFIIRAILGVRGNVSKSLPV
jgi:hypothetical protein